MKEGVIYLIGVLLVGAFVAGAMTWKGCTKPQVTSEVRVDTLKLAETDTVYIDRVNLVRRNVPVPVRDTSGVFDLVQLGILNALDAYNAEHHDQVTDVIAEGSAIKPDHQLDWRFHYREKMLDYDLTVFKSDTIVTPQCNSAFIDDVYRYGFWALLAAVGAQVVFSLTSNK